MLHFCAAWTTTAHLNSQISDLASTAESISRQIRGWTNTLQNSDIKGQRHLNDQSRQACDFKRRAEAFRDYIDDVVRQARAQRDPGAEQTPGAE